jgi:pSer/pThr/pTyr-binding forkhead associated (FHA) protein
MLILVVAKNPGLDPHTDEPFEPKIYSSIELADPDSYIMGRDQKADIVLNHPAVSRTHVQFTPKKGKWMIKDLGTANGTQLNGKTLSKEEQLTEGDQIDIGEYSFNISKIEAQLPFADETWVEPQGSSGGLLDDLD